MKIGDFLYFAPNVCFSDVDLSGARLPQQYAERLEGFYLSPAESLCISGHGFAAGLLVVSCIDAMARMSRPEAKVGERFRAWLRSEIPSLRNPEHVDALYVKVRNGLVHEARLKDGAEFYLEQPGLVDEDQGILRFNPVALVREVREALARFVADLQQDQEARSRFAAKVQDEFAYELKGLLAPVSRGCTQMSMGGL